MGTIIRQSILSSIFSYIGIGIGAISMLYLFPKFFNPTEYGAQRLLIELGALVSGFALLGVGQSVFKFQPYFFKINEKNKNGFFFLVFGLPILGLFTMTFILQLGENWFISFVRADASYAKIIFPMLMWLMFAMALQSLMDSIYSIFQRAASQNFIKEIGVRICILAVGYIHYKGIISFITSCWLIVLSYSVLSSISLFYIIYKEGISVLPNLKFLRDQPKLKLEMVKYSLWLFISSLTIIIINKIDFLMISTQKTFADTAIYSIAFYIATLIGIPKRTVSQVAIPFISQHLKTNNTKELKTLVKQASTNQLILAIMIFGILCININSIFQIIPHGDYYSSGKSVFLILGIAKLWESISSMGLVINNSNFYILGFISSIISIGIAITLNWFLISSYGINGAAIATLTTIIVSTASHMIIVWTKLKIHPFTKNHLKTIFLLVIVVIFNSFPDFFYDPILNILLKTTIFFACSLSCAYFLHISKEINLIIDKWIKKVYS